MRGSGLCCGLGTVHKLGWSQGWATLWLWAVEQSVWRVFGEGGEGMRGCG